MEESSSRNPSLNPLYPWRITRRAYNQRVDEVPGRNTTPEPHSTRTNCAGENLALAAFENVEPPILRQLIQKSKAVTELIPPDTSADVI